MPHTQMDIGMYIVDGIFPADDVLLRVRIELEPIEKKDFTEVAELTYLTHSMGKVLQNYKPVGIYKDTRVLDFGFEMRHLAVNRRNKNEKGETIIRIAYESGTQPLKIKCVNVYTKKAIDGELQATLVTGMKSPTSMTFISETIAEENGGLPAGTPSQAKIFEPIVRIGESNETDDNGYLMYTNVRNKVVLDIKISLEPSLLSMLQLNLGERKLAVNINMKSSNATVTYTCNGEALYNGEEGETIIDEDGEQLYLELPNGLGAENVLTIETVSPAVNLGLLFVALEIIDYERSMAV